VEVKISFHTKYTSMVLPNILNLLGPGESANIKYTENDEYEITLKDVTVDDISVPIPIIPLIKIVQ